MFKARFRHRSVASVRAHVRALVAGGLRYVRYVSPTSLSYGSPDARVNLAAVEDLLAGVRAELPAGGKQYFGTLPWRRAGTAVFTLERRSPRATLVHGLRFTRRRAARAAIAAAVNSAVL